MEALARLLESVGGAAFRWSAIGFVLVNAAAVVAILLTRDRLLVNRWTPRLIATNLLLLGIGLGVPVVSGALKLVVQAAATSQRTEVQIRSPK